MRNRYRFCAVTGTRTSAVPTKVPLQSLRGWSRFAALPSGRRPRCRSLRFPFHVYLNSSLARVWCRKPSCRGFLAGSTGLEDECQQTSRNCHKVKVYGRRLA